MDEKVKFLLMGSMLKKALKFTLIIIFGAVDQGVCQQAEHSDLQREEVKDAQVSFSKESGSYLDSLEIELGGAGIGQDIRLTLDGELPTGQSQLYNASLVLRESTQIRAAVFDGDQKIGPVSMASYLRIDTSLANFQSNLPVVLIETWGEKSLDSQNPKDAFMVIIEPDGLLTKSLSITSRVAIKKRGSSTSAYPKL